MPYESSVRKTPSNFQKHHEQEWHKERWNGVQNDAQRQNDKINGARRTEEYNARRINERWI